MVTFLFSVHTITEAKQYTGWSQGGGSSSQVIDLARPGVAPPLCSTWRYILPGVCLPFFLSDCLSAALRKNYRLDCHENFAARVPYLWKRWNWL